HRGSRRPHPSEPVPGLRNRSPGWTTESASIPPHQQGRANGLAALPSKVTLAEGTRLLRDRQTKGEEESMKFYTPDFLERFGSEDEDIALAAHDELERCSEAYSQHVDEIEGKLPQRFRDLLNQFYLHDARVIS